MRFLKQSTASQEILLGPFIAALDGSPQTALTIANTDIKLLKGGATTETNKASGGATHIAGGRYSAVLDASDTDTVGVLEVSVNPTSGVPFNKSYYVLEEVVYDALFAPSAVGYIANAPVNVAQFGGTNGVFLAGRPEVKTFAITDGAILETSFPDSGTFAPLGILHQGIAVGATSNSVSLHSSATNASHTLIGCTIQVYGTTQGYWQTRVITENAASGNVCTVDPWIVVPSGVIYYRLFATAPISGAGGGLDAAGTRAALGMTSANLDTQLAAKPTLSEVTALIDPIPTAAELATALDPLPTAAENALAVAQRQIPNAYSTVGTQPTVEQAILEIHRMLMGVVQSGNTLLIKNPAGATVMTMQLDSSTNPSSIARVI